MTSFLSKTMSVGLVKFLETSHLYRSHFLKSSHCLKNMLLVELFSQVYSFFIIRATTSISWICVGKYRFKMQRPYPFQTGNNRKTVGGKGGVFFFFFFFFSRTDAPVLPIFFMKTSIHKADSKLYKWWTLV